MIRNELHRHFSNVAAGAHHCLEAKLPIPALILIYTAIDAAAWIWSDKPQAKIRQNFEAWANEFLLPLSDSACTATDLFSARCGIVHTLTSDSDLVSRGLASKIAYAWGTGEAERLRARIQPMGVRVLHVEELHRAFVLGIQRCIESLDDQNPRTPLAMQKAQRFFAYIGQADLDG